MIKFIALLFTFTALNGQSILYSLPKEMSSFEYSLDTHLKNGQEIIIVTPAMNTLSLKRKLIKSVSQGSHLTLITQNVLSDPIALVAYQNVTLLRYWGKYLTNTTIIIDNDYMCTQQGALIESKTTVICTDDPLLLQKALQNITQLSANSKLYLE